ncbi:MAG: HAD-IA family hydrolase [Gammaproteobacteria bacterium]
MYDWDFTGRLVQGMGQGQRFTQLAWVQKAFINLFGIEPSPGTLNLQLDRSTDRATWATVRVGPALLMPGQEDACDAQCYFVRLADRVPAVIVVPEVDGYPSDKVELVAAVPLRQLLDLADGDELTVAGDRRRRLEAVIFDVDGTLVNSVDAYHIAAGRAAAALGYSVTRDIVRIALNDKKPFWELVVTNPADRNPRTYAKLRQDTMKHWEDILDEHVSVLPDVATVLDQLQAAGVRLGIYTGSRGESFAPLQAAGLMEYFEVVLTAADVSEDKPDPEGVLKCLQIMGVEPAAAAYIGDTAPDMGAGQRAGVLAVGLLTGAGDSAQLSAAGAHRLVPDHARLSEILLPD